VLSYAMIVQGFKSFWLKCGNIRYNENARVQNSGKAVSLLILGQCKGRGDLFVIVTGALTGHADSFTIFVKQDGDGYKCTRKEGEERACPADTEVVIHGSCEEGESGAEH
jgi:hypothetical protein